MNSNHLQDIQPSESVRLPQTEYTDQELSPLINRLDDDAFQDWYAEREFERNIREGQHYFNGPSRIPDANRHTPSSLLQCKRKILYRKLNAPEETKDPTGIFWIGSTVEEELVQPFIEQHITGEDQYVINSKWVDFTVQSEAGPLRIKGSTDPVIVDADAEPLLPFEVKTKKSVEHLDQPDTRHLAQLHAYLVGLTESCERELSHGVILYVGRTELDNRTFTVEFDGGFWENEVIPWMADLTAYRLEHELPPDEPEESWECDYCEYKHRCGQTSKFVEDLGPVGFIPRHSGYPQEKVQNYLESHSEARLTPTLANVYPDLVDQFGSYDWICTSCNDRFAWDSVSTVRNSSSLKCRNCREGYLRGPVPDNQSSGSEQLNGWSSDG